MNYICLRKAALLAAIAQASVGITTIWPEVVGRGRAVIDEGVPPWMAQSVEVFLFAALLNFYVVIFVNANELLVARGSKRVALWAALLIAIQNVPFTLGNLGAAVRILRNPLQWQFHPLRQCGAILLALLPSFWVVSSILVLIAIWRLSPYSSSNVDRSVSKTNTAVVRSAALVATAATVCLLSLAVYMLVHFRLWTLPSVIQIAIHISLVCFFALMCKSEVVRTPVAHTPMQPAR